jgi:uncharacterized protein YbaP (TraB family)
MTRMDYIEDKPEFPRTWPVKRPTEILCTACPGVVRRILSSLVGLVVLLAIPAVLADQCRPVPAESPTTATHRFDRGLLWKIETTGSSPSYLFGTFHSSDPRITTLPCPVQAVFDNADSYTMEVIANGSGIVSMAEAMFLPDPQTLKALIGDALYQDTLRAMGLDLEQGAAGINRMKPWAVMMMLAAPREHQGLFLDMALQWRATRQGKNTYGLETMAEQIAVFNDMGLADQIVLLKDAIQTAGASRDLIEELAQAYLKRDLAALLTLQDKHKPADARVQAELEQRLLTRRNQLMAERMQARLKEGNAFIAVGALHLPGENGLLQLLTAAGYRATVLY